ncbi:putative indole-3-pyruvate monooxygenase YUCCA4 [Camellia lanceoleosa]|uniref:Indole-3-pyruvate monooxygenase YUCCA4 n=1 Tax=Camellia lanceoleosa TaxID=1840588 RepID=A0ACC0FJQ9_9ERIC|nr:putative indole-3-pyruvate monooxygenase YUCCA4 [Camellia lanceoleosa]
MGSCKNQEGNRQNCLWVHGPIIVGAGPSGVAVSACLKNNGFCELPLFGFPENFPKYPTKHQFISYMESYASHFNIEPSFEQVVKRAEFDSTIGFWRVQTQDYCEYISQWIIAATGKNAEPAVQEIPGIERFDGPVVHTSVYTTGSDFRNQCVLVVGCGSSGMDASLDLCKHNATPRMVVRSTYSVCTLPKEMFGFSTFGIAMALLKWLPLRLVDKFLLLIANFTLGNTNRLGLQCPKTGPTELKNTTGKTSVIDVRSFSQIKSGKIKVMGGVTEISRNGAKFIDGIEKEFDSIILATRYKSNVPSWLKVCMTTYVFLFLFFKF